LRQGVVIPAHPLALTSERKLDERRQRALTRYYLAAGAGGVAVGVHTTQFAIRDPKIALFRPVLELAMEELRGRDAVAIAGVCGNTSQAAAEATLARELGYHAGMLSLGAMREASVGALISHCRAVAEIIPLFGFYLQPAVGGRVLPYEFWRRFVEIENVVAIKIAPFNRYQTLDVVRAAAGRDIALYTGNDDNILLDLLTPFRYGDNTVRIVGGLLGHWAVWTKRAVGQLAAAHLASSITPEVLTLAAQITDSNAALFDAANGFHGCIAGIHEILRRQGLMAGRWCLDPNEDLSTGQIEEINRVSSAYPHLTDDEFVAQYKDEWLK
jgi:dihydrodipicolinate synthase/N-acetylneuraminate lyase